ncbi:hypothetical protein BDQ17DRAFT_1374327 [Cyathus striatus]|nr:hypothetical protein BDQ17DRAFT_1374327 [Cyathus striatus]
MRLVFKCFYVLFLLNGIASAIIPPNKAVVDHLSTQESSPVERHDRHDTINSRTCKSEYCIRALGYTLLRNHRAVKFKNHQDSTHTPAKVPFSRGAKKHPDNLGLHGKDRKNVKKFHSKVAKKEMGKKSADLAQIKHLAHTEGSKDPKMHMTANLWNKNNKRIKSTYGTPPKKGDLHHLYTGSKPLPKAYTNTVAKKGGSSYI